MSIYDEIKKEREYQVNKWGVEADVTVNEPNDFVAYIGNYSTKWFDGGFTPYKKETVDNFRTSMIKTAALAIAAVEALDAQRADGGSAFFEQ